MSSSTIPISNSNGPPRVIASSNSLTPHGRDPKTTPLRRPIPYRPTRPSVPTQRRAISGTLLSRPAAGSSNRTAGRAGAGSSLSGQDISGQASHIPQGLFPPIGCNPSPKRQGRSVRSKSTSRFYLGIETEFLLQGRDENTRREDIDAFLIAMAALHNKKVEPPLPQMDSKGEDDEFWRGKNDCSWWIVTEEMKLLTVEEKRMADMWGVEMKTPKMLVCEESKWMNQVKATWKFLQDSYMIRTNEMCSTHVHVSMQRGVQPGTQLTIGMGLPNMKRIAQCVIHWETALEALVPEERRRNIHATSNWIDNLNFQGEETTRRGAIQLVEKCEIVKDLINLMSPAPQERFFAWNFRAIEKHGTIEFRKGGASVNANEALAWAEFTLLFVQAAIRTSPESLETIPSTIKELKRFLGVDKLIYSRPMFDKKDGTDSLQPVPLLYETIERAFRLEKMIRADEEEQRRLRERRQS